MRITLYPDSSVAEQEIAVNGLLSSKRTKTNLTTTYGYDGLRRLTSVTDPRTGTSAITYYSEAGKRGLRASIANAAGNTTTFDYDSASGRLLWEKSPLNTYTRYAYNSFGQPTLIWGDIPYPIEFSYDSYGQRVTMKTYRSGSDWGNAAWPGAGLTADTTTWAYDAASGAVVSKTDANGKATSYTYSVDGKPLSRTWARTVNSQPLLAAFTYNTLGQLLNVDYSDATPDITFTYNRLGQPATVADAAGTRTFSYDANFALTSETIGGIYTKTINRTYTETGAKGRILGMSIGAAGNYSYAYDAYGRLNTLTASAGSFTYTPLANSGLLGTLTRPNSLTTTWSYETNRDLVTAVSNGTLSTYSYVNDALGRRQSMAKSGSLFTPAETLSYAYNNRSEVTGASSDVNTNYSYSYAFDPIGNRTNANLAGTAVSYTANSLNQYTAVNTDNPTYDFDGNMLTNGAWTYTWNGENRLISAVNGTQRLEFSYDFMGRRVEKKVYSGETLSKHLKFVYDGYKLVEELDGLNENAILRSYTWQPDSVGLDVPLTVTAGSNVYFYSADANKNVTELTDNTGTVAAHYEYSPFGIQTVATGVFANDNPFRFSSEYYDSETGLVYYNYRYYSPLLGRWIKRDPIGEEGGWNLYGMVGNQTVNGFDKLGLESIGAYFGVSQTDYLMAAAQQNSTGCCGGKPYNPNTQCCGPDKNPHGINDTFEIKICVGNMDLGPLPHAWTEVDSTSDNGYFAGDGKNSKYEVIFTIGRYSNNKNEYSKRPEGTYLSTWVADPTGYSGKTKFCIKIPFSKCKYTKESAEAYLTKRFNKNTGFYSMFPFKGAGVNNCWTDAFRTFLVEILLVVF